MHSHRHRYAMAALVYVLAFGYILLRWDIIPDPVPVHINAAGQADGFKPKTMLSTTLPMVIGIAVSVVLPLCLPPKSLARQTANVVSNDALPFSETAAKRVEKLCDSSADVMSKMVLALSILFAIMNITLVVPDVNLLSWLDIVLWLAFLAYVVVVGFHATRSKTGIKPDADEETRNHHLRYQGGMGTYRAPNDPMAAAVLPSNPGKIAVNTAHAPGKRYVWRVALGIIATAVTCVVLPFI